MAKTFEPKWSLSDFTDSEMKQVFNLLKKGENISLSCKKEIRGGKITPKNSKIHLNFCEYWDEDYELADTIRERGGKIDPKSNEDIMNLREFHLPFTNGEIGYCSEKTILMPKSPKQLRSTIEQIENKMVKESNKKFKDIVELYGGKY